MKRPALFIVTMALSAIALADPPAAPPPGGRGGPSIERLAQDLGLDATQQSEVKRILDAQRSKMDAQRAQSAASGQRPSHEEMRAHHEQAQAELRQQLAAVLSAEQLTKFDSLRRKHPGPPPGGERDASQPQ